MSTLQAINFQNWQNYEGQMGMKLKKYNVVLLKVLRNFCRNFSKYPFLPLFIPFFRHTDETICVYKYVCIKNQNHTKNVSKHVET